MSRARPLSAAIAAIAVLGLPAPGSAASREWRPLRSADLARTEVGAGRIGNFIYVVGGFVDAPGDSGRTVGAVERYDVERNRWRRVAPLPIAVNHPAVTAHRGFLYAYGGYTGGAGVSDRLQRFNPRTGEWRLLPATDAPRAAAALVGFGDRLYAIGGTTVPGSALRRVEAFEISSRRWIAMPPMRFAREHLAVAAAARRIYALGGRVGGENLRVVEHFDPATRDWGRASPLRFARSGFATVSVAGKLVAFGGEELGPGPTETIRQVELYDPERRSWTRLPGMRTPRHGLGGAVLGRRVYALAGGPEPRFSFSGLNEFIDVPRRRLR